MGQPLSLEIWSGFATYQGDIRTKMFPSFHSPMALGIGMNYTIHNFYVLSTQLKTGRLEGDDKTSSDPMRSIRNLNFKTSINEWSVTIKRNLFETNSKRVNPFFETGIAIFQFNPYTIDSDGNKIYLRTLGTEGQGLSDYPDRKRYSLIQLSIPMGGGIQIEINKNINFCWNFSWRKTFTDYIDDISKTYADKNSLLANGLQSVELAFRSDEINPLIQYPGSNMPRGNSKNMDGYFFTGIGLVYKIPNQGNYVDEIRSNAQIRCPKF